ncbi:MAG: hypothetical protein AAB390_01700 [Patescibacteria group bacterium]
MNRKPEQNQKASRKMEREQCSSSPIWGWLSLIVIWGSVLLFVGVGGVACGARLSSYGFSGYGPRMMTGLRTGNYSAQKAEWQKRSDKAAADYKKTADLVSVFGVISNVEKNVITILDNSAAEQTVISFATTTIFSATGEVGLSNLKEGQGIRAVGRLNADNQLEAQIIKEL